MSDQQNERPPQQGDESLLYGSTNDQPIQGHRYDGIKEYDNPMPGWWVWLFVATVVFSVFYYVGITFFDAVDSYEDDLAEGLTELEVMREAYAAANPTFEADPATLQQFVDDPAAAEAGAQIFATYCAACHGDQGQGLIGPNLTDDYWIHGNDDTDLFRIITEGVPAQGMTPWEGTLTPEQRAQTVAFIRSIHGTDPPNAKAPQGELAEG